MGLKSLMQYLKKPVAVTAVTSENLTTIQRKAPIHAGCTPVTAVTCQLNDTRVNVPFTPFGEAVNDPANTQPTTPVTPAKPTAKEQTDTWRELDKAYQEHHFKCPTCIAAGRGYGLRCGAGAALWTAYSDAN